MMDRGTQRTAGRVEGHKEEIVMVKFFESQK
jgi:hypothetical protein